MHKHDDPISACTVLVAAAPRNQEIMGIIWYDQ